MQELGLLSLLFRVNVFKIAHRFEQRILEPGIWHVLAKIATRIWIISHHIFDYKLQIWIQISQQAIKSVLQRSALIRVELLVRRVTLPQQIVGLPLLIQRHEEIDETSKRKDICLAADKSVWGEFGRSKS